MGVLSKFVNSFASVPYSCYDIAHPLTDSCSEFALSTFASSFKQSLALYGGLQLVNRIISGKFNSASVFASTRQVATSSLFLSCNVYFFMLLICRQYHMFGIISTTTPVVAGLLSSLFAIYIEQRKRRKLLALYMLNLATEALYKMLWKRWRLRPLPYFDVLLFMVSLAMYVVRVTETASSESDDGILKILSFFTGSRHCGTEKPRSETSSSNATSSKSNKATQDWLISIKRWLLNPPVHNLCSDGLCVQHTLRAAARALFLGITASVALKIPNIIRRQPLQLFSSKSIGLPLFLVGMTTGGNLMQCLLQRVLPPRTAHFLAVLLSASSIAFYRSNAISLYLFWRTVELYLTNGKNQKETAHFNELLYAISCAVVFYGVIFEPESVRYSYVNFLDRLTGSTLSQINRSPLRIYGFNADSKFGTSYSLYELNPARVSPKLMEMVLIWSL